MNLCFTKIVDLNLANIHDTSCKYCGYVFATCTHDSVIRSMLVCYSSKVFTLIEIRETF
uniref:Uncharacterized protein n=1 Tax=Setaria italica TaxID=4555 RepID=A0A0Q3QQY7_SETIT